MFVVRLLSIIVAAVGLAGCMTGYGDKLDAGLVQSLRLERIEVSVAPDATFWWGDGERAYARSIGRSEFDADALGKTPEGRTYMRSLASQRIKAAFDRGLAGGLRGTRPARIVIVMHDINVASPVQRILVGGNYTMKATANLVDARTGQVIAANPNLSIVVPAGQGVLGAIVDPAFGEPIDRLAGRLAETYRFWLLPAEAVSLPPRT